MSSAQPLVDNGAPPWRDQDPLRRPGDRSLSVIHFPDGLAGFEQLHEFKLFTRKAKPTVFTCSRPGPRRSSSVVNPDNYQVSYECAQ